jgi:glucose/arabinose dehydrogenase
MPARLLSLLAAAALLAACGAAGGAQPTAAPAASAPTAVAATAAAAEPSPPPAAPTTPPPDSPGQSAPAPTAPPAAPTAQAGAEAVDLAALRLRLEPLGAEFARPTGVSSAGDGSGRLFITEQAGRIMVVRDGAPLPEPFLDLTALVGANGNEQGLLSVAFHPRYAENGLLYVNYTDRQGDTVIARYSVSADSPDRADPASAKVLLTVEQPAANHNGGLITFGPDGMLYVGLGDGGAAGDPWGNGQKLDTLLGKLLRLDVDGGDPYAIPAGNPFVGRDGVRPEIWAYGLRNPWRFSFDRATGDLYIADVGQNAQEEVNFQPASSAGGENYGWNTMEGDACFRGAGCDQTGLVIPVAVYSHSGQDGGCSITGGYVYRGAAFPQLAGTYLYTDYCTGNLWGLRQDDGGWESALIGRIDIRTSAFGEDEAGELFLTDRDGGGLYRLVAE